MTSLNAVSLLFLILTLRLLDPAMTLLATGLEIVALVIGFLFRLALPLLLTLLLAWLLHRLDTRWQAEAERAGAGPSFSENS